MCARQMDPHVKIDERPERANIHEKASPDLLDAPIYPRKPRAEAMMIPTNGRPLRSMYVRSFGAWRCSANAASVREEP